MVRLIRIVASTVRAHFYKLVSLQDNGAVSGALGKGRSPSPSLTYLARQRAASSLAAIIQALLPRVETHLQPADALSRLRVPPSGQGAQEA